MNLVELRLTPKIKTDIGKLDKAIREVVIKGFYGLSTFGGTDEIAVHIDEDEISKGDIDKIKDIVDKFDPATVADELDPFDVLTDQVIEAKSSDELKPIVLKLIEILKTKK